MRHWDNAELVCTKTDGTKYDFDIFALWLKFVEKNHNYEIILDEAMDEQDKFKKLIIRLDNYRAKNNKKRREKICRKIISCERRFYWLSWKRNFSV